MRIALTLAALAAAVLASSAAAKPVVYDDFDAPGGYTLADYGAKWSNIYGLGDMAAGPDTRSFADGSFAIADAPFRTAFDFSVFDHLKYIAISNAAFDVPELGSLEFESDIKADTPGTQAGRIVHGTYVGGAPYAATVLQGQQAGAVMNMVNFATGQLFDWFVSGNTAFSLIERLPSSVTGSTSPDYVGPSLMYTQIVGEYPIEAGVYHHVAIRYTRGMTGDNVKYLLDGKVVDVVTHVGIPLDRRGKGTKWTGIYPSLGPGELLRPYLDSFAIGHGTFSLLDAFPFQWGWTPDPTLGGAMPCVTDYATYAAACAASVSIPLSERLFGQGVNAHFDNFTVDTKGG
jgi:Family of unknown function (DUF6081)